MERSLARIVSSLREDPDVVAVYLFGSHATGATHPESDVDIGIVLRDEALAGRSRADVASAVLARMEAAGRAAPELDLDAVVLNVAHPLAARDAIARGRLLWAGDRTALAQFAFRAIGAYEDWRHLHAIEMNELRRRLGTGTVR